MNTNISDSGVLEDAIAVVRACGARNPRTSSSPIQWYDDLIVDRFWGVLFGPFGGNRDLAKWMLQTGKPRFLHFVEEYGIAKRVISKGASPVDSLQRNRMTLNRSGANGVYTSEDVYWEGDVPLTDHPSWFRDQDRRLIFTSHPYFFSVEETRDVCTRFAERVGLRVEVRPDLNFYSHLERTPLIVWRSR